MNLELRSVSYSGALSQETSAFTAKLYLDGKPVGSAENNGCGGSTLIRVPGDLRQQLIAFALTRPHASTFEPLEDWVDDLLSDHLLRRDAKRHAGNQRRLTYVKGREVLQTKAFDVSRRPQVLAQFASKGITPATEDQIYAAMRADLDAQNADLRAQLNAITASTKEPQC